MNLCFKQIAALLLSKLPYRAIMGGDGSLYLSRWLLYRGKSRSVFIHRFHQSDEDRDLHNHPWSKSKSFILKGGYIEERRSVYKPYVVTRHVVKPFTWNHIDHDTFHRVDLLSGECWSLFFAGKRVQSWGFWDRDKDTFVDFRQYLRAKGIEPVEDEY